MNNQKPIVRRSLVPTKKEGLVATKKPSLSTRRTFTVAVEGDELVLRLPITAEDQRKISKSGKSIIIAGTSGTRVARQKENGESAPIEINGKALRVCATAWISADGSVAVADVSGQENSEKE